jgi:hypothetical protein
MPEFSNGLVARDDGLTQRQRLFPPFGCPPGSRRRTPALVRAEDLNQTSNPRPYPPSTHAERKGAYAYRWASVTPDERELALLVAPGLTNNGSPRDCPSRRTQSMGIHGVLRSSTSTRALASRPTTHAFAREPPQRYKGEEQMRIELIDLEKRFWTNESPPS